MSSLPAETRPEGFAPGGCHAAREHGSTCQLSALPHGAAARTTVCMFGSLKPSDRSSGLRSFGLAEADRSGILSGSRPIHQRLVCVEAGQTISIDRMEVLTPQASSIHCHLTRGRSLVRTQPGSPRKAQLRSGMTRSVPQGVGVRMEGAVVMGCDEPLARGGGAVERGWPGLVWCTSGVPAGISTCSG